MLIAQVSVLHAFLHAYYALTKQLVYHAKRVIGIVFKMYAQSNARMVIMEMILVKNVKFVNPHA